MCWCMPGTEGRCIGSKGKFDEVREVGAAQVSKDLGTTTRSLDFIPVTVKSHWRASHLSLHHLADVTLWFQEKEEGTGRNT